MWSVVAIADKPPLYGGRVVWDDNDTAGWVCEEQSVLGNSVGRLGLGKVGVGVGGTQFEGGRKVP